MKLRERTTCSDCKRSAKRLAKLENQLAKALTRIEELEKQNAKLEEQLAKLRKNSRTSSKPPSSDIVKPNKTAEGSQKTQAGRTAGARAALAAQVSA